MTSTPVSSREVAQRLYAAISRGDAATIAEIIDPHALLTVPGDNPVAGTYEGMEGFLQFTDATRAIAGGGARTEVIEIMGAGQYATVYGISHAARPGRRPLTNHTLHLLRVERARVTAVAVFNRDQSAVDEFWSPDATS